MDTPDYELSPAQKRFVKKAKDEGYKVNYGYSGRGMYGKRCPSVVHERGEFGYKGASQDSMGLSVVTYMVR